MEPVTMNQSPLARLAIRMAILIVAITLALALEGAIAHTFHLPSWLFFLAWLAFATNTYILAPIAILVIIAGFLHIFMNRDKLYGLAQLAASLIAVMASTAIAFLLTRWVIDAAM